MKLTATPASSFSDPHLKDWIYAVSVGVRQRHTDVPFANSLLVSEWLHEQLKNPRITITTSDNGQVITVAEKASKRTLLTINCNSVI